MLLPQISEAEDYQQHKEFMFHGVKIISSMKKFATDLNLFENLDSTVQEIYSNMEKSYKRTMKEQN